MLTVKEILTNKVVLDIACIDRVYLNGYVKHLQMPGGLITFIREQMGFPIPSPMVLPPFTQAFRKAVEQYAKEQGLSIVDFAKGEDKDEEARAYLAKFEKKQGVVLIGKAQEKALGYKGRPKERSWDQGVVCLQPPEPERHLLLLLHFGCRFRVVLYQGVHLLSL